MPSEISGRVFRKLQLIDDAAVDADLRSPPSNHFEKLSGALKGFHSIRVNQKYRIVFRWFQGVAEEVYLDDHSYR